MNKYEPGKKYILDFIDNFLKFSTISDLSNSTILEVLEDKSKIYVSDTLKTCKEYTILKEIYENNILSESKKILYDMSINNTLTDYMIIIRKIVSRRIDVNISISQLARKVELPEITVKRIENIQSVPRFWFLLKFFDALNLDFELKEKGE